jgi:CDP-glucose 4,6-dehydratase
VRLAEKLHTLKSVHYQSAFNFAPRNEANVKVIDVVKEAMQSLSFTWRIAETEPTSYEATVLRLDTSKALDLLSWESRISFSESISHTMNWYLEFINGSSAFELTQKHIQKF